jgi:hypothetical protein
MHLYFRTLRDVFVWAMAHGCREYVSTPLGYDPKLHLGCRLLPLDLYVRHRSSIANFLLRRVMPLLEPTRYDPILKAFPNFHELRGPGAGR